MQLFQNVAVVGMHFREKEGVPAKTIVGNFVPPVELTLEREPENPYDLYAIKVLYDNQHIGYVEAATASYIATTLDENPDMYSRTVEMLEPRGRNLYPIVTIEVG